MPAPDDVQQVRAAGRLQARDLHTSMPLHDKPTRVCWAGVVAWVSSVALIVFCAFAATGIIR